MTCVEKRLPCHRAGGVGMLHHRFPNGFTEVFMDETDREVSSLTDRAFRSLCVGDEAVYNDDFSYGYSPFSCHKPLVETASKKTPKEAFLKKQLQQQQQLTNGGSNPLTARQNKEVSSTVSSLLKAFGTAGDGGEGSLTKNGYSWDKSALLSIQQELSEFSSDYHSNLSDGQFNHKNSRDGASKRSGKDGSQNKNGKSSNNSKLRKLNIKNFFLHSEFSPFQAWRDLHRFPFSQGDMVNSIVPSDNLPKWYDSPLYKELTEAHRIETLHTEATQTYQDSVPVEPTPPPAPPVPPKVLPKPLISLADKRCSSEGGEAGAPWRRNRARAKSAVLGNKPGVLSPPNDTSKQADVSPLPGKKEVEVKAVEEPGSVPSTPFNISQLMTPVIPSRQPTETSEVLQMVFSSSALDLPLRPGSEAKVTTEPPVKRESYKSIASSLLFNLKDNRKRVKSRYSPSKFKTSELTDRSNQSPRLDPALFKYSHTGSDGTASGFSTPAILKDGQPIHSPILESSNGQTVSLQKYLEPERPISDDYLISNLLQTRRDAAGSRSLSDSQENTGIYGGSPFVNSKMNKSPLANKQSYPSLNLYKKASPETEVKTLNKNTLSVPNDNPAWESTKGASPQSDSMARPARDAAEIKDKMVTTRDIIRAAKEAISAAKNKALSSTQSESTKKQAKDAIESREKAGGEQAATSKGLTRNTRVMLSPEDNNRQAPDRTETQDSTAASKTSDTRRAPPPVPKRATSRPSEKHQSRNGLTNGDAGNDVSIPKETAPVRKQGRLKHIFSARQNNYIKSQRSAVSGDGEEEEEEEEEDEEELESREEDGLKMDLRKDNRCPELAAPREIKDSEHIINDLHALKELERARLGDRENMKNKTSDSIEEEAKAKNDLISRELRNIKRGMLSMRGNSFSKREPFAKKEREQSKTFEKNDGNVLVNKSLINDNYAKAKMALEEVITERLKNKGSSNQEEDGTSAPEGKSQDDSYATRVHDRKQARQDAQRAADEKQNGAEASVLREKEVRERLGDLRDHNHMKHILSQTENKHSDNYRVGTKVSMPAMDRISTELHRIIHWSKEEQDTPLGDSSGENEASLNKIEQVNVKDDEASSEASSTNVSRQTSVETNESQTRERRDSRSEVPPVPPRVKKGLSKKDGSSEKDTESVSEDIWQGSMNSIDSEEFQAMKQKGQPTGQDSEAANEKQTSQSQSVERSTEKHKVAANLETDTLRTNKEQPKSEQNDSKSLEQPKIKRKAPLRPGEEGDTKEHKSPTHKVRDMQNLSTEKPETPNTIHQDISSSGDGLAQDEDAHEDTVSPSLLNIHTSNQSPPDRSSQSSKSSYFSVESTLHRNTETDSAIYHSLENLIDEMDEEEEENAGEDLEKTEVMYYSVSDRDSEGEVEGMSEMSATEPEEVEIPHPEVKRKILWSHVVKKNDDEHQELAVQSSSSSEVCSPTNNLSPVVQSLPNSNICSPTDNLSPITQSPASSNVCSPTIEKPALFKVKDNTFNHKRPVLHVPIHELVDKPQLLGESWSASERGGEDLQRPKDSINPYQPGFSATRSDKPAVKMRETSEHTTPSSCSPMSPSNLAPDGFKASQYGAFLTVPQDNDRALGLSPSSEGMESQAASTADTGDTDTLSNPAILEDTEEDVSKVPSERSGSVCSGNDSQGPSKPPVVPPKSEKALRRAMKLTTRRIQKEEAKTKPAHKSRSSSKHGSSKRKGERSEQNLGSQERHQDRAEHHSHSDRHDRTERSKHSDEKHSRESKVESGSHKNGDKHHRGGGDHGGHNRETGEKVHLGSSPSQRLGQGGGKHSHEKYHSADGIVSDVPVYKALPGDRQPVPENKQRLQRSQSIDRYVSDKAGHKLTASENPACDRANQRSQRIERSIMDELQQRGRVRDRPTRDRQSQRSRSIDTYISETADSPSNPTNLSRQSSYTSQLSRQSSIEHTIVTQSFPMTQRKLLQDPDSGQYFVVDMPVQVKTKTFFDPETGNYVQLPVQPPEGAVPQASTMEVLNTPLVLYHGFVPVPVSSVTTQPSAVQASQQEQELEQRLEMARQKHTREGHPYLEPVYRSQDHMLGEFLGTEELDCMS